MILTANREGLLAFTSQWEKAQNDSFNGQTQELNLAIWLLATFSLYLISSPSFFSKLKNMHIFSIHN